MKQKKHFYTEFAYLCGMLFLAAGTKLMELADFGMSMVVAPSYVLYVKFSTVLPWLTFGMTQTLFQVLLLFALCLIMRKYRVLPFLAGYTAIEVLSCVLAVSIPEGSVAAASPVFQTVFRVLLLSLLVLAAWKSRQTYLLAFVSSFFFGLLIDGISLLTALVPAEFFAGPVIRHFNYVLGVVICSMGVAMLFRTYLTPEVFELFVMELSEKFHIKQSRFKTAYDIASTLLTVVLSFLLIGMWKFEGVGIGTVACALVNGMLIGLCTRAYERLWTFRAGLPKLQKFFQDSANAE